MIIPLSRAGRHHHVIINGACVMPTHRWEFKNSWSLTNVPALLQADGTNLPTPHLVRALKRDMLCGRVLCETMGMYGPALRMGCPEGTGTRQDSAPAKQPGPPATNTA